MSHSIAVEQISGPSIPARLLMAVALALGLILSLAPAPAAAQASSVLYVTPGGSSDCKSWATACTLQYALTTATAGAEIWVAEGTYKPTTGFDRRATFRLKRGVGVYGGFAGTETARSQRDWVAHPTVLSGDIRHVGIRYDNAYHVVTGSGTDNTAVLDGFTVSGGHANSSSSPNNYGGGMINLSGSPRLANVTFSGNSAANGGGMYTYNSSPRMTNVTFSGNSSSSRGGGMFNYNSSPRLTNVIFSGNSAATGGGGLSVG